MRFDTNRSQMDVGMVWECMWEIINLNMLIPVTWPGLN